MVVHVYKHSPSVALAEDLEANQATQGDPISKNSNWGLKMTEYLAKIHKALGSLPGKTKLCGSCLQS